MISTIEFHGHTVVAPITGKDMKMVAPLEDYFIPLDSGWQNDLDSVIEMLREFFEDLSEQERKNEIRVRDDHKCLFCDKAVDSDEVHEIIGKGAAGGKPALVPWNQVTVCRHHHELLQQNKWTIYRFDPLDKDNGLIVIGQDGSPIPKDKLWFYNRPDPELARGIHEDYGWITRWNRERRAKEWEAGMRILRLRNQGAWKHLGEASHKSMLAGALLDTGQANTLEKAVNLALDFNVLDKILQIDEENGQITSNVEPEWAMQLLKAAKGGKIDKDQLPKYIVDISGMSKLDYNAFYDQVIKGGRKKKRHAIKYASDKHYKKYEVGVDDTDGLDADLVIDGGRVVKGEVTS